MDQRSFQASIELSAEDRTTVHATLECTERNWDEGGFSHRICKIVLRSDRCEIAGEGSDFFDAFCRIREALAERKLLPLCYGASRNTYPSGMGRDMGAGLKIYRYYLGRASDRADLVKIFDTGSDIEPVSVAEQEQFWRSWLKSRGISVDAQPGAPGDAR